jgi:hypothetical protein
MGAHRLQASAAVALAADGKAGGLVVTLFGAAAFATTSRAATIRRARAERCMFLGVPTTGASRKSKRKV